MSSSWKGGSNQRASDGRGGRMPKYAYEKSGVPTVSGAFSPNLGIAMNVMYWNAGEKEWSWHGQEDEKPQTERVDKTRLTHKGARKWTTTHSNYVARAFGT